MSADRESRPVLILTGPPGVGKTTTAAALADRFEASVHLESDYFFRFIRTGFVEPWQSESQSQNEVVMRIAAGAAAGYAAAGYFTIVDGIVIPGWFLEPIRDALRAAGHEVAYAVLRAPLETCIARVREREGGDLDADAVEQLWHSFADLGPLERNVLEVGGSDPGAVAGALAGRLEKGTLGLD